MSAFVCMMPGPPAIPMEPVYTTRGFCPDNPHGFLSGLHLGSEVFSTKFLRTGWSGLQKLSLKVGLTSGILKFSAGTQVCPDDGCQVSSHFWPFCPDFHPALFKNFKFFVRIVTQVVSVLPGVLWCLCHRNLNDERSRQQCDIRAVFKVFLVSLFHFHHTLSVPVP